MNRSFSKDKGVPYTLLRVSDYTSLVANGLATNETTIKEHPEQVRGMVKALLHGISDASPIRMKPTRSAKSTSKTWTKADPAVQKAVLMESIEYWKSLKPGATQPDAWENMQTLLLDMGLLEKPVDLTQAYTNDYLPAGE